MPLLRYRRLIIRRVRRPRKYEPRAKVNFQIRAREVRVIGSAGEQLGVMSVRDAIEKAQGESLDLVEVAANENPPVCRIVDFGKYLYDDKKKKQETKRKQTKVEVKECKFRPKIGDHDFDVRIRRAVKFLSQGNKVKLTVMFRGREHAHPEVAQALIERAFEEIKDLGKMEAPPRKEGRDMHVIVTPLPRDIRNKAMKARGIDPDQNKADLARDIKQKQDEERGITSSDD
ncbi:MAG TPA: translation initiation factor IF-3, partial [bacterium]